MHTQDSPLPFREIRRKLIKFGIEIQQRKGAKVMLYHPNINGKPASYPMDIHKDSQVFSKPVIRAIRDRFGISLQDFYNT